MLTGKDLIALFAAHRARQNAAPARSAFPARPAAPAITPWSEIADQLNAEAKCGRGSAPSVPRKLEGQLPARREVLR